MLNEDKIAELKSKHGDDLIALEADGQDMVFKRPTRAVWTDFIDTVTKDRGSKEIPLRRLALACVVHPTMEDANKIFDKYPALPAKISGEIADIAGSSDKFDIKKL